MRLKIAAVVAVLAVAGAAHAQSPQFRQTQNKLIDTNSLVVKPVTVTTNIFAQSAQVVSQTVAGMVDNSQILRTVNNLFGQRPKAAPTQGGISPLPDPKSYPSNYYNSPIKPVMPSSSRIQLPGR